ncbi:MAG: 2-C-methyl-D-erythritol 4-phosphate cytidylyltransferase, partial [Acidimicrobiia bacterium]|nr:2-C-methyl-D-erythritol 4-phosphate cytidylyltransferase [Acidimicrobiia bacterium]
MLAVIVLAGGSGSRFGASGNKVYAELDGRPVLAHSLTVLARDFAWIVIVHREGERDQARAASAVALGDYSGQVSLVSGGATRTASERSGLEALRNGIAGGEVSYVAVHDGARPYLTTDLVGRLAAAVVGHAGAIPGVEI